MVQNFDLEDFNMLDVQAKKVLEALGEFDKGHLVKGDVLHIKTGLLPKDINDAVRVLSKSKLVNIPNPLHFSVPYDFYEVEITDFGRQVLEQYG